MRFSNDNNIPVYFQRRRTDSLKLKSNLELTPLVNVVFLLLLFLIVSSTFIQRPGVKIELPTSSSIWGEERESIYVSLTYDDILFLNEKRINWDKFPESLNEIVLKLQNPLLIINADEKSMHGKVIKIMDVAKETGIENIVIATQPPEWKK
ncbi:MAG: biopolymer transporter ExbD [Candidatus Omnitrophica bacterium]|nr:biopolymer transporter ExbD [Candidatus Omnitrophota bacterium]MBU1766764.1 biopolymer transporter ExbD [Candidatus Omnitrophota bacterium]